MENDVELSLVGRMCRMEPNAWAEFCRNYGPRLRVFVRYRLGYSQDEAEEAVQMTLLRCIRSINQFNPNRGDLMSWLHVVSRNEAFRLKRRERTNPTPVSFEALPDPIRAQLLAQMDTRPLADELLMREDVQAFTLSVLDTLPKHYRDALVMKYMEGSSVCEIANELGGTEKAAESTLSRARRIS